MMPSTAASTRSIGAFFFERFLVEVSSPPPPLPAAAAGSSSSAASCVFFFDGFSSARSWTVLSTCVCFSFGD